MYGRHNPADEAGNFLLVIFKVTFWVLVTLVIPALYSLITWLVQLLVISHAERNPNMSRAKVIGISTAVWTLFGSILAVLVAAGGAGEEEMVWTVIGSVLVGLAVGAWQSRGWLPPAEYVDEVDPAYLMDVSPSALERDGADSSYPTVDELDEQGVVLGINAQSHEV